MVPSAERPSPGSTRPLPDRCRPSAHPKHAARATALSRGPSLRSPEASSSRWKGTGRSASAPAPLSRARQKLGYSPPPQFRPRSPHPQHPGRRLDLGTPTSEAHSPSPAPRRPGTPKAASGGISEHPSKVCERRTVIE